MTFTTLCSSSQANIICYNFVFGRNSKQIKAWGKKNSTLTNRTRNSCSRPLKSPKATNKTNWAEKLFVTKQSFSPRFKRAQVLGTQWRRSLFWANAPTSAGNTSQEWHLWMWPRWEKMWQRPGRGRRRRGGWVQRCWWNVQTENTHTEKTQSQMYTFSIFSSHKTDSAHY